VIFDRSWYNRAGVERVMGFCKPEETERFLEQVPSVEKAMVDSGILLLKYWLEVSPKEQTRRLERRIQDPRKVWKLSDMDLRSYSRWYDHSRARDAMFAATDNAWAPWYIARTDDKQRGRLNLISHLLSQVPTSHWSRRTSRCPGGSGPAAMWSQTARCGTSPRRIERQGRRLAAAVTEAVVRAGGGIVWRRGEGGAVEIVLVHRPTYDDWAFPKGKLHPGETEAQAALREVQEETSLRCRRSPRVSEPSHGGALAQPTTDNDLVARRSRRI
jgi:Polyphosphate kinase 2 (PPK2)/NUDIX domain